MDLEKLIKMFLSKKDPRGYFIILANLDAKDFLSRYRDKIEMEEIGDILIVKTRSRQIAKEVLIALARMNMLKIG